MSFLDIMKHTGFSYFEIWWNIWTRDHYYCMVAPLRKKNTLEKKQDTNYTRM